MPSSTPPPVCTLQEKLLISWCIRCATWRVLFYTRTSFFSKKMAPQSGARFRAQTLSNHLQLGRKSLRGPEKWAHFWGQILATKVWPFVLAKIGAAGAKKTPQPHDFLTTKSLETNPFQTHEPNSTGGAGWRPTVTITAISLASTRIY